MPPPPPETRQEKIIHKIFVWGVVLKAFDGVAEILGGIALFFTGTIANLLMLLLKNEFIEDPHDVLATYLTHTLPYFLAHSGLFAAVYLLSHGIVKLGLAAGLLRDQLWAYPSAIVVFILFIVYQIYRYTFTHSPFLILLTLLDLAIIWLTWHEYRYFKKHRAFAQ